MNLLVAIFMGVAVATIYLLVTPITVFIWLKYDGKMEPMGGIRIFPFPIYKTSQRQRKQISEKSVLASSQSATKMKSIYIRKMIGSDWETFQKVIAEMSHFLFRVMRLPDNYRLCIKLEGAFDEPHITGIVYGAVCAVESQLPGPVSLVFRPDFSAQRISGELMASVTFRLTKLIRETIVFVYRLPKWRLLKLIKNARKG